MNNFANAVKNNKYNELTETENKAVARKTTGNALLDFFASAGAIRNRSEEDIISLFSKAFKKEDLYAVKALFYTRNVRGGLGERKVFRTILKWLAENYPEAVLENMQAIPEFGRWDDLFVLIGTPIEEEMIKFVKRQLRNDCEIIGYDILWK